ncbi:MAG: hypothetical protein L6R41_001841 [Letrouitia leprolyta]|nr:MAG: hypothetical protein L6R41_001841 [Letrouitia leprolyta]
MALDLDHSQQSQSSSIGSIVSRPSDQRPFSNHDLSSPGTHYHTLRGMTPSTSLSNQSSQEQVGSLSPPYQDGPTRIENVSPSHDNTRQIAVDTPSSAAPSTDGGSPQKSHTVKRTAGGEVKVYDSAQWVALEDARQNGHSRNISTASKSSQVSELSHELRTRLSYAMFKVQNGLQLHNLSDLEAMTRPKSSSSRTSTQSQQAAPSPTSPKYLQHPSKDLRAIQKSPSASHTAYKPPQPLEPSYSPSFHQADITDGLLRQNHTNPSIQKPSSAQHSPYRGPTLAPPVDILPRSARPSHAPNTQLPSLNTGSMPHQHLVDPFLSSDRSTAPTTPSRRRAAAMQTPSHKAAMEKDAVETLMFMSSPGNAGHYPAPFGGTGSPGPKLMATSPKRVGFAPMTTKHGALKSPHMNQHPVWSAKFATAADIDRVLDEIPDQYSSSDADDESPLA